MRIADGLRAGRLSFSFEFFPPKTPQGEEALFAAIGELRALDPTYVSVTYGAGGGTREHTVEWVRRIKHEVGIEAMAHLTCVGHSRDELGAVLDRLRDAGIENVIALRGDPPRGESAFVPHPEGLRYASELVRFIRGGGWDFCLAGACYPEGHLEAPDRETDLGHLVVKVEAGVEFLITQMFFDNAFYFDFVRRAREAGITLPILPGIMPITNVEQIERFTRLCGATVPMRLTLELDRVRDDPDAVLELGVAHATAQCLDLVSRGAPGIHFYTLNKSRATRMILAAIRGQLEPPHP